MNKKKLSFAIGLLAAVGAGLLWTFSHCHHKYSRPFTWKKGKRKIHYVTCLECGHEFQYDMDTRIVGEEIHVTSIDVVGNREVV